MSTNEFDEESTQNYKDHQEIISKLSISTLVNIYDLVYPLINGNSYRKGEIEEIYEEIEEEFKNVRPIIKELLTEKTCPHCKTFLFKSDTPQYDYVCTECDENFYECEV